MIMRMLKLGVNVDHVATVREARGTDYPSVVEAALICERSGVYGITVHLREDRRHIQDDDVRELKRVLKVSLNLEMGNSRDIVDIALDIVPAEVCLVPEKREELTTEGGLDVAGQLKDIGRTVEALKDKGVIVSLFIDPELDQIKAAADVGAPFIELHTGAYCDASGDEAQKELKRLISGAERARELGLHVNAGHGLNLENIDNILQVPYLEVLNIGHSIVARSVFVGLENAVKEMLGKLEG